MSPDEMLDRIAQQGLFGKKYKNFESAPAEAQRVIRFVARSNPSLPPHDSEAVLSARPDRPPQRPFSDARLRKLESSIARIDKALSYLAAGLARIEQLDIVASASRLKMDRSQRMRATIAKAQREGRQIGRPPRDFSREEVARLRGEGMTFRQIALKMNLPLSTVADGLKSARKVVVKNLEMDEPNT